MAMIFGWFLMLMVATGHQKIVITDTLPVRIALSLSIVTQNNHPKTFQIDSKEKPSSSEDGYHKNRNIIIGVIIGVILIVMLLK